jgi:transcriptional regulator with XRE-family HTH domain
MHSRGPYRSFWKRQTDGPIAVARRQAHLTQAELADRLGIARARIAQWESGARPLPRAGSEERAAIDAWLKEQELEPLPADETHRCQICDRALTDPESIVRGIGPECAHLTTPPARKSRKNRR